MVGSEAIIGLPDEPISETNPGYYDLTAMSVYGVIPNQGQALLEASIEQNSTHTVLTFTRDLNDGIPIDPNGNNWFLVASGTDNTLGFHGKRGSAEIALTPCTARGPPGPPARRALRSLQMVAFTEAKVDNVEDVDCPDELDGANCLIAYGSYVVKSDDLINAERLESVFTSATEEWIDEGGLQRAMPAESPFSVVRSAFEELDNTPDSGNANEETDEDLDGDGPDPVENDSQEPEDEVDGPESGDDSETNENDMQEIEDSSVSQDDPDNAGNSKVKATMLVDANFQVSFTPSSAEEDFSMSDTGKRSLRRSVHEFLATALVDIADEIQVAGDEGVGQGQSGSRPDSDAPNGRMLAGRSEGRSLLVKLNPRKTEITAIEDCEGNELSGPLELGSIAGMGPMPGQGNGPGQGQSQSGGQAQDEGPAEGGLGSRPGGGSDPDNRTGRDPENGQRTLQDQLCRVVRMKINLKLEDEDPQSLFDQVNTVLPDQMFLLKKLLEANDEGDVRFEMDSFVVEDFYLDDYEESMDERPSMVSILQHTLSY